MSHRPYAPPSDVVLTCVRSCMKILYLTDPGIDYLADQIYTGLCRVLGAEEVIDFPWKPHYHDPAHKAHFLPQNRARRHDEEEVASLLEQDQVELVVLSSPREGVIRALARFAQQILPPLVLLDGEDDTRLRTELFARSGCSLYFKREFPVEAQRSGRGWLAGLRTISGQRRIDTQVYPLPFSAILDTIPADVTQQHKDVDISYAGRVSHRKRSQAVVQLQRAQGIRFEGGVYAEATDRRSKLATNAWSSLAAKLMGDPYVSDSERGRKLSPAEYYQLLGRSKMALSIRGGGFDTLRYWEIVSCKVLLVSERPDIVIPNNFEHRRHAVFCKPDLSDLVDLVRSYVRDDAARIAMVNSAYDHLLKYHTCERRAEQFLDVCKRYI